MRSIVWLASYPKSGNTWVRTLIANYLFANNEPLSINKIHQVGLGDSIPSMYQQVCEGDFDPTSIPQYLSLRPKVLQGIVNNKADINFVKTHNANIDIDDQALIPHQLTRGAIVIVRNPLDVVVSMSNQLNIDVDAAVDLICQSDRAFDNSAGTTPQFFTDWSTHAESWLDDQNIETHLVRYEDLLDTPEATLSAIVEWVGLPFDEIKIEKAVRFSNFDKLKSQEQAKGFVENTSSAPFFNSGKRDQWKESLSRQQVDTIIAAHRDSMETFNYLN